MSQRKRLGKPPSERRHPPSGVHVFRCPGGMIAVRITEHPDHVTVVIAGKPTGPLPASIDRQFDRWLMPLMLPFENDARPLWIEHEDGSRRAFVHKVDDRVLVATATALFEQKVEAAS
jgi:hypothetical protein